MSERSEESAAARSRDRGLAARFAAAFDGRSDPADALLWLDRPRADGPSGATSPTVVLERMRSQLYRRGAATAAVSAYLAFEQEVAREHVAALRALKVAERSGGRETCLLSQRVDADHRRSRLLIVAALVLALVFTATTVGPADGPAPTTLRFLGPAPTAATEEAAISALFTPEFAARSGPTRSVFVVPPAALTSAGGPIAGRTARVFGTRRISLGGLAGTMRRRLTVLVVCSGPGAYAWSVYSPRSGPGTDVQSSVRQDHCARAATSTTVDLQPSDRAPVLRFSSPSRASAFVAIALTRAAP